MASIIPAKNGKGWRAMVSVAGKRKERTFASKREAQLWAERVSLDMRAESSGQAPERRTLRDAMRRYATEIAPTHKGERWEVIRLAMLEQDAALPVTLPLAKLTPQHFAAWRDKRGQSVGAGSVLREMSLLGSVLSVARRDWGWINHSPLADVRRPRQPAHRERVITWGETRAMLRALDYPVTGRPISMQQIVGAVFVLALRTGMRAGEITGLEWARVHGRWVTLAETKSGTARDVPLSARAARLIERMRGLHPEMVFPISEHSRDALFRKARDKAGLSGFRFHDARHSAATRIGATVGQPGRLSFPEFVRVFGWKDPKMAMIYCNPSAESLADKL